MTVQAVDLKPIQRFPHFDGVEASRLAVLLYLDQGETTGTAFYRQRAEAAGLASVMAMNTGEARAYGAAAGDGSGKLLHVVATPVEGGPTSVQLDWTNGR